MAIITKNIDCVDIVITPKDMATIFWGMDAGEQAEFFNRLGEVLARSPAEVMTQFQWIGEENLSKYGKSFMQLMGEYVEGEER